MLLANRRLARLFAGDGDELEETDRIEDDVHRRHDQGGWSQANYQRSIDKEVEDHLAHTAEVAFEIYKRRGFDRLLVGAPDELVAELETKLHPYLRQRLAGRISCDVEHSSLDAVRRCAGERVEEHARHREREQLDRLAHAVGSGDRGAAGLAGVLAAVNEARVEVLLVARGMSAAGVCDPATGQLYARPEDSRRHGRDPRDGHRREAVERRSAGPPSDGHPPSRRPGPARRHRRDPPLLMRVAVLGTGIMGAPMARNLATAGHEVRAWNRSRERAEPLAADGVVVADSPAEAVRDAEIVVTMLSDGAAVEAVTGELGFPGGAVWAQMSTVGIAATERLVARAAEAGVPIVDAPVLGTKAPAEQGQLTVIAAGPRPRRASAARRCSTQSAPAPWRSATSRVPPRA